MNEMRILLLIAMLCGLVSVRADEPRPATASEPQVARQVPLFSLKNLDGLEVCSTNYAGSTRLVWFWASWDKPCQRQLPDLIELQRDLDKTGLRVLALVLDAKDPAKLKEFATENSVNFPILVADYGVIQAFGGLEAIPTLFVVEPHGMIVSRYVGYTDKGVLRKLVQAILDTPR